MSTIFQRLFGSAQLNERGKTMQVNTIDEMPIDDPDELAVEEEFRKRAIVQPENNVPKTEQRQSVQPKPVKPAQVTPVTEANVALPASEPPLAKSQPVKAKPQARPTPPSPPQPSQPVRQPSVASSSDMARLQSLAKASGLKTSMDNVGKQDNMMFDIEVIETGDDGRPTVHIERGVMASSESELRHLYALSDQKINIIRTYGGNVPERPFTAQQNIPQPSMPTQQPLPPSPPSPPPVPPVVEQPKEPPKYFNVSGVECKLENGKVYQRQWVRLAGADAESFRLVNDVNNKIVPIDGKHIEQKKWVLIQDNPEEGI